MINLSKIKKLIFFPLVLIALIYEPIESKTKVLRIGAIPDQNQEILDRRFSLLSKSFFYRREFFVLILEYHLLLVA